MLTETENNRTSLCVVLAGYREAMEGLMRADPGLVRRFPSTIHLDDYSPAELAAIARQTAHSRFGLSFAPGLEPKLAAHIERTHAHEIHGHNASLAVALVEAAINRLAMRLMSSGGGDGDGGGVPRARQRPSPPPPEPLLMPASPATAVAAVFAPAGGAAGGGGAAAVTEACSTLLAVDFLIVSDEEEGASESGEAASSSSHEATARSESTASIHSDTGGGKAVGLAQQTSPVSVVEDGVKAIGA